MSNKQAKEETQPTRPLDEGQSTTKKRRKRRSLSSVRRFFSRLRRRLSFSIALIFIITIGVSVSMVISTRITDATSRLDSSWQRFERVLNNITDRQGTDVKLDEFTRLRLGINDVEGNIRATQSQLRFIDPLIDYNDEWKVSAQLLNVASQLTISARVMLDGLAPVVSFLEDGESSIGLTTQISAGERIVDLLEINQSSFRNASGALNQAENLLNTVDLSTAPTELILSYERLKYFHRQLSILNSVLLSSSDVLSQFMGMEGEVVYLILAQNNDSIRPSGGSVEAYGWFKVRNGRITDFDFSPSSFSNPAPPSSSFVNNMSIPNWWLAYEDPLYAAWAGSWYVDFPSTAQMAIDYYNAGDNPNTPVNGIIAVDLRSLEKIVGVLDSVDLPTSQKSLTLSNFRDTIYDPDNFSNQGQENYLATIYNVVFEDLQNINQNQSVELLAVFFEALTQHHMMIYVPDTETQEVINLLGWTGDQIEPGTNDYLLVADTNLVNASDHSIIRSLTYDVEIFPDQSRLSNLRVRYDYFDTLARNDPAINPEYFGDRDYSTLTQLYLPNNIVMVEEQNMSQTSIIEGDDYRLFVTQLNVAYDTSEEFQVVYETPATENRVENFYRYRLLVEKQPGLEIQDLELKVKLPPNASIIWYSQRPDAGYVLEQPIFDFRLQIASDQWIEIIYSLN